MTKHLDGLVRAAAADDLRLTGDLALRLRCIRDLAHLAALEHRDLSELASLTWMADRLLEDVEAAEHAGQGQSLQEALA